jgi:hypothetical protein
MLDDAMPSHGEAKQYPDHPGGDPPSHSGNFHSVASSMPIRNNRAAWQWGCLQTTRTTIKPGHFGDVISTGKLLSPNVYFQIEMEN